MFCERNAIEGKWRNILQKQQKENTYPLQRGENSKKRCPVGLTSVQHVYWNCTKVQKRYVQVFIYRAQHNKQQVYWNQQFASCY